jgi:phenylacetate-CoA ligase
MTRQDYDAVVERRLVAAVRRAYERIPFYRRRWPAEAARIKSRREFEEIIPFLSKPDFLDRQDAFMTDRVARPGAPVYSVHMTSGTTGLGQEAHPLTRLDAEAMGSTWVYQATWAGLEIGDTVFYTFPVGMQTGGLSSFFMTERMASRAFQLGPYNTEKKIEYLLRYQPNGLVISPAYLTRFQAVLEGMGIEPRRDLPGLKAIFIAGEGYTVEWAMRTQEFWGALVSEWYGLMQGGLNLCFSCETGVAPGGRRGHLHTMQHRVMCEVLHPGTNEPVLPGEEGEIVITALFREAFPVIRFRSGDKVRLMAEPCRCGRPFMCIEAGTVSRYDDMMKIRGQNLWPDAVDKIVFAAGDVEEYAGKVSLTEDGREQVEIALEFRPAAGLQEPDRRARVAELAHEIQTKLNVRMDVSEVPHMTLPRFEFKVRRWSDARREGRSVVRYVRD